MHSRYAACKAIQLLCSYGSDLKMIAAILEMPVTEKMLTHLVLNLQPPRNGRVREARCDVAA